MSEPIQGCSELDETEEGIGELVIPGGDATVCFDAAEEVFHLPAVAVVATMEVDGVSTTAFWRNADAGALLVQAEAKIVGIKTSVCDRAASADCSEHREGGKQVVPLSAIEVHGIGPAPGIDYRSKLGVEATLGSPHSLRRLSARRIGAMLVELNV